MTVSSQGRTSDTADQMHRSWVAPPHVFGSACCRTSKVPVPTAAANENVLRVTA